MATSSKPPLFGGLVVSRPRPFECPPRSKVGLRLMTDTHLGSSMTDESLIQDELKAARKCGDRIILGGDVFDLILPGDRRRYAPSAVHKSLRGRDDLVNAAVERAADILLPYADLIDGIGLGNHETATLRSSSVDAVRLLVDRLGRGRDGGVPIAQLGYTAILSYGLQAEGKQKGRYVVWYHHGSGKASSAHLSLKKLLERMPNFEADLYWSGHSHARASCSETVYRMRQGRPQAKDVRCVVTGSYMQPYGLQGASNAALRSPKTNYASDAGLAPHGVGGARVVLTFDGVKYPAKVEVIQ